MIKLDMILFLIMLEELLNLKIYNNYIQALVKFLKILKKEMHLLTLEIHLHFNPKMLSR